MIRISTLTGEVVNSSDLVEGNLAIVGPTGYGKSTVAKNVMTAAFYGPFFLVEDADCLADKEKATVIELLQNATDNNYQVIITLNKAVPEILQHCKNILVTHVDAKNDADILASLYRLTSEEQNFLANARINEGLLIQGDTKIAIKIDLDYKPPKIFEISI